MRCDVSFLDVLVEKTQVYLVVMNLDREFSGFAERPLNIFTAKRS